MALIEVSLSTNQANTIDTAAGVSGTGVWVESIQSMVASESLNPTNTVYRFSLDAVENSTPFSPPASVNLESYCRDESGNLYALCSNSGNGRNELYLVDPLSGSGTKVGESGPTYGGSPQGRAVAYFSGTQQLVWIPTATDPYSLGSNKFIVVTDLNTLGWPLVGGTDNAAIPGGLSQSQVCASWKDLSNFFIYDVGGSTQFWEVQLSTLTVVNTGNLPRANALACFDPVSSQHIMVIHDNETGTADDAKIAVISELDDITSMDVRFLKPRYTAGTFITVIPRNSQGLAQPGRIVSAALSPGGANAVVLGSLESTVETTGSDGAATFRYSAPASNPGEPDDEDDIDFTVQT